MLVPYLVYIQLFVPDKFIQSMNHLHAAKAFFRAYLFLVTKVIALTLIVYISVGNSLLAQTVNYNIRLNQIGFYPNLEKIAYVVGTTTAASFTVESLDHTTVFFTGTLNAGLADFSNFTTPGKYVLNVQGTGYSAPFIINEYAFNDLSKASLKGYYYKRASTAITAEHGGVYARAKGHPDTQVMVHTSAASPGRPAGTIVSSPKGWYDAGDYNCYVVNSNISTYTLLAAYEHFGSYYDTLNLNIPESGNGMPDILNEIKWNLDWMLTMQDPYDGAVYDKKTTANFSDFIMPDKDQAQRYLVGKSGGATYGFAAVMAVAYRVYLPFDPVYANQCLVASKRAYASGAGGSSYNSGDITTGVYNIGAGNKPWAGIELYISTKDDAYYVPQYYQQSGSLPMWQDQSALGLMSFVHHRKKLTAIGFADTTNSINKLIASARPSVVHSGYSPLMYGGWGANSFALNEGMMDMCAYLLTKDRQYLNAAIYIMDYILGKNGSQYCFVTSFGSKRVMHPHDRISSADGIAEPVPGWVVGGNNYYVDDEQLYEINEVAINWNAPLVFLSGAIQYANTTDLNVVIKVFNNTVPISSNHTPALSFGSSILNVVAGEATTITIRNSGINDLIITSITSTAGFDVSALSSANPIAPGASSTFTITATPLNLGINTGAITIKTNDKITSQFVLNVTVRGKPVNQPFLEVFNGTDLIPSNNTPSVLINSIRKGTAANPITITLANEGTSPLIIYSVTGTPGFEVTADFNQPIEADASVTCTITATAIDAGVNEGVISIQTNDPANPTFLLNVSVKGLVPVLTLQQESVIYTNNDAPYIFDPVIEGEYSRFVIFEIKNAGTFRLTLEKPELTGPFYMSQLPAYLEPGQTRQIFMQFTPTTTGDFTGTFTFETNADDTPFILNLSGKGMITPEFRMKITQGTDVYSNNSMAYSFPYTTKGTASENVFFTITNTGTSALFIKDLVSAGPFELTEAFTPTTIDANNSISFPVIFKPVSGSFVQGSISIVSSLADSPFILNVSGLGRNPPAPVIQVKQEADYYISNSSAYKFANTLQGGTSTATAFTINNVGNTTLSVGELIVSGPFELTQSFTGASMESGQWLTFSVVFKPVSTGDFTGNVMIINNSTDSPFIINLSGTGALATGTVGILASDAISIRPNPAKEDMSVQLNGAFNNVSVNVYNALGEQIVSTVLGDISNASFPVSLTNMASGMYIVEVITDQGNSMKRVIKE